MQYFIHRDSKQLGPFTEGEVKAQLAAGTLSPSDLVWSQGQADWTPLGQSPVFAPTTPAVPGVPPPAVPPAAAMLGAPAPTSKMAIWALVCGCCSLLCGIFASVPAIILGHMSLSEIKKTPGLQGKGMALAGLILGYVFTTLIVIYLISIVVLIAMGTQVKDVFKTIDAQIKQAQAAEQNTNSDANPAASTNGSSDTTTNPPATTPDQSTNSADSSSTNAPASTNAPPSN